MKIESFYEQKRHPTQDVSRSNCRLAHFLRENPKPPGMSFGSTSITALHLFINGCSFAAEAYKIPKEWQFDRFSFEEFEKWLDSSFNSAQLSSNSFGLAARLTDSEEAGFYLWFSWYGQFRRERGLE